MSADLTVGTVRRPVHRYIAADAQAADDLVALEEPLQISLEWPAGSMPLAVTMRTPGDDVALALGFLWGEGLLAPGIRVTAVRQPERRDGAAEVCVVLDREPAAELLHQQRNTYLSSSCGICAKAAVEAVRLRSAFPITAPPFAVSPAALHALPDKLSRGQALFAGAGSVHAAALFTARGELETVCEDVGRHNALDKVIGAAVAAGQLPLRACGVAVSGRASFELVQKAHMAGIPLLAAVGAPSSLAIELAWESGMTLVGFLRDGRFNVYSVPAGIVGFAVNAAAE